jgi:hypothetical protein
MPQHIHIPAGDLKRIEAFLDTEEGQQWVDLVTEFRDSGIIKHRDTHTIVYQLIPAHMGYAILTEFDRIAYTIKYELHNADMLSMPPDAELEIRQDHPLSPSLRLKEEILDAMVARIWGQDLDGFGRLGKQVLLTSYFDLWP